MEYRLTELEQKMENQSNQLAEVIQLLKNKENQPNGPEREGSNDLPHSGGKSLGFVPKVEFRVFEGSNPRVWIKKCMKYFNLCKILDHQKVDLASLYLIGKAESWYNSYIAVRRQVDWEDFVVDLCSRFKEDIGSNVVEEFNKLSQSGTIDEYLDAFENLKGLMLLRNPLLPEEYFLDSFVGGLRPNLKHFVRAFKLATLIDVVEYARLQNAPIQATSSTTKYQPKPISTYKPLSLPSTTKPLLPTPSLSTQTQSSHNTRPYRPTRYLTPAERADKQAKGHCYFCDAPYDKGQKCQIQQT